MKCYTCVYSLFAPIWICLSPREKPQRNGNFKQIEKRSECHNGDFTERTIINLKQQIQIQRAKDALNRKGE